MLTRSSGLRRTLNSFHVSGVKAQRGFAEPEHVEAGVAIATPDGNKKQEHGPIVKTKIGTSDIPRAQFAQLNVDSFRDEAGPKQGTPRH